MVNNKVPQLINIAKLAVDQEHEIELDKSQDWVCELLRELNEKANSHPDEYYIANSSLNVKMKYKRVSSPTFGDTLCAWGTVETNFFTECVRTLQEMNDSLTCDFIICFVENHFAEDQDYEDQTEVFINNDIHDMHFYELNKADLKEMLHEVIYLNINQYPVADYDTPLEVALDLKINQ
jgi:uncharacterized protein